MIVFDYSLFDPVKMCSLIHRIKNTKHLYDEDLNPDYSEKGRRYHDDERVARMVCGYFLEEFSQPINGTQGFFNVTKANEKLKSLDSHQIDPYIKRAVVESAESDYHYNNEKEW